jgi:hypothetical protein
LAFINHLAALLTRVKVRLFFSAKLIKILAVHSGAARSQIFSDFAKRNYLFDSAGRVERYESRLIENMGDSWRNRWLASFQETPVPRPALQKISSPTGAA